MNKITNNLLLLLALTLVSTGCAFGADVVDATQQNIKNDSVFESQNESSVDKEDVKKEKRWFKFLNKKSDNTDSQIEDETVTEETPSLKHEAADSLLNEETQEEAQQEKEHKTRKFFSKAEKAPKDDEQEQAQNEGPTTDVLVDSEIIEYFPERHEFEAVGNAKVSFPSEKSVLYADKIIFNHDTNYIKGYGHVVLVKEGQKINGDYIQVDLNEDNAMMTHPVLNHMAIKIRAKTGIVNEAQTEALDGVVTFNDKTQFKFVSRPIMGFDNPMMDDAIPKNFYFKEKYDNKWRLKAKTIVIDSYKDHDVATLKNADIYIQNTKLGTAGNLRLFTNKEQEYIETNMLEMGSLRNLGAFVSPGWVFKAPFGSTLKVGPAATYDDGDFGVGALARFLNGSNRTDFGWSTANDEFVVRGRQRFTDNLSLQYGINSYMNNGFMGGRMPDYGFQFDYRKNYQIEDLGINFTNRFMAGLMEDWGPRDFSTTKFAWQTQSSKSFFKYQNPDYKFAMDFGLNVQSHVAAYGTGDTMGVLRAGPYFRTQYRSWQQYVAYFQGGQAGDSPFYFDKNFYGKSNIVLGESLRICRFLTLMYTATIALSDTPNDKMLQENRFWFAIGPDDMKFLIGYDAYRQNATMGLMMNVGAENAEVEFRRLVLNDPSAIGQGDRKDKQKRDAKKKKEEEEKKAKEADVMNRSVKDYKDYNPQFNMMPGGAMLQPSLIRPPGM